MSLLHHWHSFGRGGNGSANEVHPCLVVSFGIYVDPCRQAVDNNACSHNRFCLQLYSCRSYQKWNSSANSKAFTGGDLAKGVGRGKSFIHQKPKGVSLCQQGQTVFFYVLKSDGITGQLCFALLMLCIRRWGWVPSCPVEFTEQFILPMLTLLIFVFCYHGKIWTCIPSQDEKDPKNQTVLHLDTMS